MNKIYSDDGWVVARNLLLKKVSSQADSDEYKNKQSVTRIFHGLYAVTTKRYLRLPFSLLIPLCREVIDKIEFWCRRDALFQISQTGPIKKRKSKLVTSE